jgi:peroxiredoxin Q/BCP
VAVIGSSPDMPYKQKKFDEKYQLGFPLLSDPDHRIADTYAVWGEKKMYGKTYMGIIRSAFLVESYGRVARSWYKISPKNTVPELYKHLGSQTEKKR